MANIDTRELSTLVRKIEKFRASIMPMATGILVKQVKVLSQQQQKSFDGTSFAPLTPAYKKRKMKAGHAGVPNLTYSGKFMNEIGFQEDGTISVPDTLQPQAKGLDKKRKIWGVHPDSERLMEHAMEQAWENVVNAA